MAYNFIQLNPRLSGLYGIEVTVPGIAARCDLGNLDPQHTGQDSFTASIEAALTIELPPDNALLGTIRRDPDSVGTMAVLEMRRENIDLNPAMERIMKIAASDKFAHGGWPGPQSLPTKENPWPLKSASTEADPRLAAIAAFVSDWQVPIEAAVKGMRVWLLSGEVPVGYQEKVQKEREELIRAIEAGEIKIENREGIAVVQSTHRAGTTIGYSLSPIAVLRNPEFGFGAGPKVVKFTVCQFEAGYVDLKAVFAELSQLEPGWGGSPTIGGSPQGVSSTLTLDQVVEIVRKHLLK